MKRRSEKKARINYREREQNLQRLGFTDYREYLASSLWKKIRKRVLDRDAHRCRTCGRIAKQVHHGKYDYRTMTGRDLTHLAALCAGCHKKIERHPSGEKRSPGEVGLKYAEMRRGRKRIFPLDFRPEVTPGEQGVVRAFVLAALRH